MGIARWRSNPCRPDTGSSQGPFATVTRRTATGDPGRFVNSVLAEDGRSMPQRRAGPRECLRTAGRRPPARVLAGATRRQTFQRNPNRSLIDPKAPQFERPAREGAACPRHRRGRVFIIPIHTQRQIPSATDILGGLVRRSSVTRLVGVTEGAGGTRLTRASTNLRGTEFVELTVSVGRFEPGTGRRPQLKFGGRRGPNLDVWADAACRTCLLRPF